MKLIVLNLRNIANIMLVKLTPLFFLSFSSIYTQQCDCREVFHSFFLSFFKNSSDMNMKMIIFDHMYRKSLSLSFFLNLPFTNLSITCLHPISRTLAPSQITLANYQDEVEVWKEMWIKKGIGKNWRK